MQTKEAAVSNGSQIILYDEIAKELKRVGEGDYIEGCSAIAGWAFFLGFLAGLSSLIGVFTEAM